MGRTSIEWTDHAVNPIRARARDTGRVGHWCERVSAGCQHCYASALQELRFHGRPYDMRYRREVEVFLERRVLAEVLARRAPTRYFWCDMSDLFGAWVPDAWIDECVATMARTPQHTHLLLTKRPERMRDYLAARVAVRLPAVAVAAAARAGGAAPRLAFDDAVDLPLGNVWCGVSVEDQSAAEARVPVLLDTPAAARFVSCEPLLGPVDLSQFCAGPTRPTRIAGSEHPRTDGDVPPARVAALERQRPRRDKSRGHEQGDQEAARGQRSLEWVIVGGESGRGARPMRESWVRDLRDQCLAAGVPFFYKQRVVAGRKISRPTLDGEAWTMVPALDVDTGRVACGE